MPDTTPRLGIVTPTGTESPNTNAAYKAIADAVDALAAIYGQGTLAARPTSSPGTPGKAGRFYMVTSGAETGQLFYDYGTGWIHINPNQTPGADSITAVEIAPLTITGAELAANAVSDAGKVADGIIGAAEIANALKPSAGAGAATEALRALGTAAGTAAAGTHASQHARTGADPLPVDSVPLPTINQQTGSYTLVAADANKIVEMAVAGANNLTVPANSTVAFPIGTQITVIQTAGGQTTIVAAGGVTVNATPGLKIAAQWGAVTLIKRGTDTWLAVGNLVP